jgi:ubiquinone/menaquinone biosynthesis C-methylase UbiE
MNKSEKDSIMAYNQKAGNYDNTFDGKFTLKFKQMLLETVKIKTGDTVLDVACGNGRLLNMFAEKHTINGYGIDISDKMIEQAKILNPSMHFSIGSCEQIPYADNTFDIITVCAAYHHFPHVYDFAKEAYRLLKKNGEIYIAEVYYPAIIRTVCNPFVPLLREGDVKFYSPDKIMETLKSVGFQNENYIKNDHVQIVNACR